MTSYSGQGGLPKINLANVSCSSIRSSRLPQLTCALEPTFQSCNNVDSGVFAGTNMPNCQFLAEDIKTCQKNGKLVTVSIGGADSSITLSSDADAQNFGETIYNTFLGGKGQDRPFGDGVILDG